MKAPTPNLPSIPKEEIKKYLIKYVSTQIQEMGKESKGESEDQIWKRAWSVGNKVLAMARCASVANGTALAKEVYDILKEAHERAERARQCREEIEVFLSKELILLQENRLRLERLVELVHQERLKIIDSRVSDLDNCRFDSERTYNNLNDMVGLFGRELEKTTKEDLKEILKNNDGLLKF